MIFSSFWKLNENFFVVVAVIFLFHLLSLLFFLFLLPFFFCICMCTGYIQVLIHVYVCVCKGLHVCGGQGVVTSFFHHSTLYLPAISSYPLTLRLSRKPYCPSHTLPLSSLCWNYRRLPYLLLFHTDTTYMDPGHYVCAADSIH